MGSSVILACEVMYTSTLMVAVEPFLVLVAQGYVQKVSNATKELREVSAPLYHLLKSHKAHPCLPSRLINRLQLNDELLETNLSTTLQTVWHDTILVKKKKERL